MTKTSTQNDLIRFLYDETRKSESEQLKQDLLCNSELLEEFNEFVTVTRALSELKYEPSKESINSILDYSKSTKLRSAQ